MSLGTTKCSFTGWRRTEENSMNIDGFLLVLLSPTRIGWPAQSHIRQRSHIDGQRARRREGGGREPTARQPRAEPPEATQPGELELRAARSGRRREPGV